MRAFILGVLVHSNSSEGGPSNSPRILAQVASVLVIPPLLFGCTPNRASLNLEIEEALREDGSFKASEFVSADQYCIFPTGTVVPGAEARRIFDTERVDIVSNYNSDGYWFFAAHAAGENSVMVVPVSSESIALLQSDIYCDREIYIKYEYSIATIQVGANQ